MLSLNEFALKEKSMSIGIDRDPFSQAKQIDEDEFMRLKYFLYQKHVLKYYQRIFQSIVQK